MKIEAQNNWIVKFFDFFEFKIDLLINLVFKVYHKAKFAPYIELFEEYFVEIKFFVTKKDYQPVNYIFVFIGQ